MVSRCQGRCFDFGLYAFHNAKGAAVARGQGLILSAEDGESSGGAALERCVIKAEGSWGFLAGSIKATVLIETILASFEME